MKEEGILETYTEHDSKVSVFSVLSFESRSV